MTMIDCLNRYVFNRMGLALAPIAEAEALPETETGPIDDHGINERFDDRFLTPLKISLYGREYLEWERGRWIEKYGEKWREVYDESFRTQTKRDLEFAQEMSAQ